MPDTSPLPVVCGW